MGTIKVMLGNEACAEGAIAAGLDYFAGYPITPASEIAEVLANRLPVTGGRFIQMEDEIASAGAMMGAAVAGAKAMTATSGPGFSLMQENIGFAAMAEIPCVIVNVMRLGPSSGIATLGAQGDVIQARHGSHGDYPIAALAPASAQEMFDMTAHAFWLSEKYRSPIVILADGMIAHLSEKVCLPKDEDVKKTYRKRPLVEPSHYRPYDTEKDSIPPMAVFGDGYRWYTTGIVHDETGFPCTNNAQTTERQIRRLLSKFDHAEADLLDVETREMADAEIVIAAFGVTARSAYAAVKEARRLGYRVGLFRFRTIWPFPEKAVMAMLDQAKAVLVPEMNDGQIYGEIRKRNEGKCKVISLTSLNGMLIKPHQIVDAIKECDIW